MIIIYNPADGAPINGFIFNSTMLETHYPDGYLMPDDTVSKGLMQYEDDVAEELLETYQFLTQITPAKAEEILKRAEDEKFVCDFPECEFKARVKVALVGHQRKHQKDRAAMSKPAVDPTLIPIAGGKRVLSLAEKKQMVDNGESDIPNGPDKHGVEWYGDGATVENNSASSFAGVRKTGQGHFRG